MIANSSLDDNSSDAFGNLAQVITSPNESLEFKVIKLFLYALIFLLSVSGNTLVCIVIIKRRRMRSVTNYFILNLAVADLAITCVCIPFDIPVQENNYKWIYGSLMWKLLYPLQTIASLVSIFTLVAVSLNRFWAIVYPLRSQLTIPRAKAIISAVWVLSALVNLPYILVLRLDEDIMSCEENWPEHFDYRRTYTLTLFLVQYVAPLIIITFTYIKIAHEMRKCVQERNLISSDRGLVDSRQNEARRVVRMLVVVTILFAVCVLPNNIMWLWLDFGNGGEYEHFWDLVAVTNIMLFANSAANPIAYTFCNENFRHEFRFYLPCYREMFKSMLETSSPQTTICLSYTKALVQAQRQSAKAKKVNKKLQDTRETDV
ncbi:neuropeptide FF receptor 1-like [Stylophora pistillata]|uniref:neuropeptide FF receptor 1-like n=1 Tax=Stylophora pistillata TaxID=50429 RepID=UPI000C03BCFE|nr:neuropeptide FF receptor 1-like [Stylophora pistillata]